MKPCEATCPKCGSLDIHRQHKMVGEVWNTPGAWTRTEKAPWPSEFLKFDNHEIKAHRECITHHCRDCGFDWETATRDAQLKEQIMQDLPPALQPTDKPSWPGLTIDKVLAEARQKAESSQKVDTKVGSGYKLQSIVCGLCARVEFYEGALVVDLDTPSADDLAEFHGPRLFVSRAKTDDERRGWRILVHPDEGDPTQCVFVGDDGQVQSWTDAQEETHWPGGI